MIRLETVRVAGILLEAAFDGDLIWVPARALCNRLDLPWEAQRKRIRRTDDINARAMLLTLMTAGGPQRMLCLALHAVSPFLLGLDTRRHHPERQAAITALRTMSHAELNAAMNAARQAS